MKRFKFTNHIVNLLVIILVLITPSYQQQQQQQKKQQQQSGQQPNGNNDRQQPSASADYPNELTPSTEVPPISVPYFRASIPMRIYECLREFSTLRCTKLYVLQKMEERKLRPNTGNITKDFLNQFFGEDEQMGSLISDRFRKMSEKDLNKRLVLHFQRFFKNRDIKLHFLPGLMVKIIPSKENKVKFSLKKKVKHHLVNQGRSQNDGLKGILKDTGFADSSLEGHENTSLDEDDVDIKSKHKDSKIRKKIKKDKTSYKTTVLQMAVPVMIMPAILMGTFLPFILPVLKMATLTTMIMNNTAFMAALIYAARTHVNAQEEQPINYTYGHPGFH
ncbi:hypothetical protein FF38_11719 [Lucilia cuprina]|uniref:Uncharacterized protein n=1 Tax=Lucilia cuprina TaxID=7375 RepID=A0A0L0CEH7_LUCCU|nr:hypothetical protein CVS40_6211 [Lucilia cuprina]KNC30656.1 hypothetical protein FF38_11719 [Lucilia cuprina]